VNGSIYVYNKNGKPIKNKKSLFFVDLISGRVADGFTDSSVCTSITSEELNYSLT